MPCHNPAIHNELLDRNIEKAAEHFLRTLRIKGNTCAVVVILEACGCSKQIANVPDLDATSMLMEAAAHREPETRTQ